MEKRFKLGLEDNVPVIYDNGVQMNILKIESTLNDLNRLLNEADWYCAKCDTETIKVWDKSQYVPLENMRKVYAKFNDEEPWVIASVGPQQDFVLIIKEGDIEFSKYGKTFKLSIDEKF